MSTEHITAEIEAGLKAARKLKEKNDAERQRLLDEQASADQALVDNLEAAAALANAAQQQHEDDSEGRQHRLAQANRIAGASAEPAPAAPEQPPAEPEPQVVDHDANGNGQDDGNTSVQPAVQDHDEPEPQAPRFNGRPQTFQEWLLALLGLLIGLVVGVSTRDWFFGDISGTSHDILVVIWVAAFATLGFFAGGWLGWRLDHRHPREH